MIVNNILVFLKILFFAINCDIICHMNVVFTLLKILLILICTFLGLHILFAAALYLISLTVDDSKPIEKQKKIYRYGCVAFCKWACGLPCVRVHVSGEEKIPTDERFVFISNHRGYYDPLSVTCALSKYNISFLSKPSNMKIPGLGKLSYGAGYLPINRGNDREALKTIIQAADYMKKDFCSMGIYPEGTRNSENFLLPFHAGSFKLAKKAKSPIVIASTRNSDEVFKHLFIKPTDIYIDIIEVVSKEKVSEMSTKELSDYSYEVINGHLYGKN